ncbi:hypothetical protein [Paenibacillus sp. sgz500958]|uniref:hypothetical protein n=1 Tax=Paenibacillus sp. sgz500958 TaxID=3242475 RepID=UPI0036D29F3C
MIYVLSTLLFFVLLAGGILAYQNSRLISEKDQERTSPRPSSRSYSAIFSSAQNVVPGYGEVPLFKFTSMDGTLILSRTAEGKGEMNLSEAQQWVSNRVAATITEDSDFQLETYPDMALGSSERMAIMKLTEAVHSNHSGTLQQR